MTDEEWQAALGALNQATIERIERGPKADLGWAEAEVIYLASPSGRWVVARSIESESGTTEQQEAANEND